MERLLTPVVTRLLQSYVKSAQGRSGSELRVVLSGGSLVLHSIELNLDPLLQKFRYLKIHRAYAKRLQLVIPWTALATQPIQVRQKYYEYSPCPQAESQRCACCRSGWMVLRSLQSWLNQIKMPAHRQSFQVMHCAAAASSFQCQIQLESCAWKWDVECFQLMMCKAHLYQQIICSKLTSKKLRVHYRSKASHRWRVDGVTGFTSAACTVQHYAQAESRDSQGIAWSGCAFCPFQLHPCFHTIQQLAPRAAGQFQQAGLIR